DHHRYPARDHPRRRDRRRGGVRLAGAGPARVQRRRGTRLSGHPGRGTADRGAVPAHQPHRRCVVCVGRPEDSAVMTPDTHTEAASVEEQSRVSALRLLAGNPVTVASAVVLAVVVFVAVTASWIAPFGVNDIDVPN